MLGIWSSCLYEIANDLVVTDPEGNEFCIN